MGCSCLGPAVKIKSNISVNNLQYSQKKETNIKENAEGNNVEDFSKSCKAKISTECSNISSSYISISDDDEE